MINIDNNRSINNNINDCGKNFRTPLTPLHRGGLWGLLHRKGLKGFHILLNNRKFYYRTLKQAFSLIELSIVLIIIGLLVAGVTGGKSLIDSARSRALINEIREYERAVWTFRAARDRFPGDVMNYGTFGLYSNYDDPSSTSSSYARPGYTYKETDFPSDFMTEFRKTAGANAIPEDLSAPFVDLYTEGIIDFKPLGNTTIADKSSTKKATPNSKAIDSNNVYLYNYYVGATQRFLQTPASNKFFDTGIGNFSSIKEVLCYYFSGANATKGMNPKILKQVDVKMDDGLHWNGRIRSRCYGKDTDATTPSDIQNGYTDYDYAIENGKKCSHFYYAL